MSISDILNSLLTKIAVNDDAIFSVDINKQREYLNRFDEPKDDIQRSYYQYKCQMFLIRSSLIKILINLGSLPLIIYYLLKKNDYIEEHQESSFVFFSDGKPENILPLSIRDEGEIRIIESKKECIDKKIRRQLVQVAFRYPFSWHLILKVLIKLKYYCYVIKQYNPRRIITCNEYSFTSSILTQYCESLNIQHINVMHGEKLYFIRDSFFRYHKCYVWDEYYKSLLCDLRADSQQFIVEVPPALLLQNKECYEKDRFQKVDYTYYLASEKEDIIEKIVDNLKELQALKRKVRARPHPRYTLESTISYLLKEGIEVENISKTTIEDSLKTTKNAISLYSTVLNQAYNNKIGTIIDDLSDSKKYLKLAERRYRFINDKSVKKLSEVMQLILKKE